MWLYTTYTRHIRVYVYMYTRIRVYIYMYTRIWYTRIHIHVYGYTRVYVQPFTHLNSLTHHHNTLIHRKHSCSPQHFFASRATTIHPCAGFFLWIVQMSDRTWNSPVTRISSGRFVGLARPALLVPPSRPAVPLQALEIPLALRPQALPRAVGAPSLVIRPSPRRRVSPAPTPRSASGLVEAEAAAAGDPERFLGRGVRGAALGSADGPIRRSAGACPLAQALAHGTFSRGLVVSTPDRVTRAVDPGIPARRSSRAVPQGEDRAMGHSPRPPAPPTFRRSHARPSGLKCARRTHGGRPFLRSRTGGHPEHRRRPQAYGNPPEFERRWAHWPPFRCWGPRGVLGGGVRPEGVVE